MTTELIPLDKISNNPWQTRTDEDPAHVHDLALSIAEHGLLQTPVARPHPDQPGHVQLAFGHSRLLAYRLLCDDHVIGSDKTQWQTFPLTVRPLTDRQMSDLAAEENSRRKNLSAIQTARAIQKRMIDFALTQLEAGAPFGYKTASGVANVLRLLELPEPVQASVHNGDMPERIARQFTVIAKIAPQQVEALVKKTAKQEPAGREEFVASALDDLLDTHGRDLERAPWDMHWLKTPIPVASGKNNDGYLPDELRACAGCPFMVTHNRAKSCAMPGCYDLKQAHWLKLELERVSAKLGILIADPSDGAALLFGVGDHNSYHGYHAHTDDVRKLLKAKPERQTEMGLRLASHDGGWWQKETLGSPHIALAATNLAAVKRFLEAGTTLVISPNTPQGKKDAVKQKQQAEAASAQRRDQRGRILRAEHDVVWLVRHVTPLLARQLTIRGPILRYVVGLLIHGNRSLASQFYGLLDWYDALEQQSEKSTGKAADELNRQILVASQIFEHVFTWEMVKQDDCWEEVGLHLRDLCTTGEHIQEYNLGVKLPPGWNKPPIHRTDYNCWTCGDFAGQRRLTKRDMESGWTIVEQAGKTIGVTCPDCGGKDIQAVVRGRIGL